MGFGEFHARPDPDSSSAQAVAGLGIQAVGTAELGLLSPGGHPWIDGPMQADVGKWVDMGNKEMNLLVGIGIVQR